MKEEIAWDRPMVQIIGILVIILLFIVAFASVSSSNLAGEAKAQSIPSLGSFSCDSVQIEEIGAPPSVQNSPPTSPNFMNVYNDFKSSPTAQKASIVQDSIKNRKKQLVDAMRTNPSLALSMILPEKTREELAASASGCIEQLAEKEGRIEVIHADDFENKVGYFYYTLVTDGGQKISLHPTNELNLLSGARLKVRGYQIDNEMLFDNSQPLAAAQSAETGAVVLDSPEITPVLGEQKTVMLMVTYNDYPAPAISKEDAYGVLSEMNNYYKENSYDKIYLTGDVFGWFTLNINKSQCRAVYPEDVINVAEDSDDSIDFHKYERLILIIPRAIGYCGGASGTIGKVPIEIKNSTKNMSVSWIWVPYPLISYKHAFEHEFGHNLGLHHANFLRDVNNIDASQEYGDGYDVMGTCCGHFNAISKERLGWLSPLVINESGNYSIGPIEANDNKTKALKIPGPISRNIDGLTNNFLYVEYRQPIGEDRVLKPDVFEGVLLHTLPTRVFGVDTKHTFLIDTSPPPINYATEPALKPSFTFTDSTGTSITSIGNYNDNFLVNVNLVNSNDKEPPAISSINLPYFYSGKINIPVSASDDTQLDHVEFFVRPGSYLINLSTYITNEPFILSLPGIELSNAQYIIVARAYDAFGNMGVLPPIYLTPHLVSSITTKITSPLNKSTVQSPVNIEADVYSDIVISKVEFWKYSDEEPFYISESPPYQAIFNAGPGTYYLWARAYGEYCIAWADCVTLPSDSDIIALNIEKPAPVISSITPSSATPNSKITLAGTSFTPEGNTVVFGICQTINGTNGSSGGGSCGYTEIKNTTSNSTHITTIVPQLSEGLYDIYVSNANGKSNSLSFTVLPAKKTYIVSFISVASKDGMATSSSATTSNDFSNMGSTPQGVRRAFLYFDTSSIPSTAVIKSAKLTVKGYNFAKAKCVTTGNINLRVCNFDPLDKSDFSACLKNAKNTAYINLPETSGAQKVSIVIDPVLVSKQGSKSPATQFVLISQNEACKTGELGNFARICSDIKSTTSWLACQTDADKPVLEVTYEA